MGNILQLQGLCLFVAEEGWIAGIYERQIWNSYDQVICHTFKPSWYALHTATCKKYRILIKQYFFFFTRDIKSMRMTNNRS